MLFECRKAMKWGPGRKPIELRDGDEVAPPIKANLIQRGWIAQVDRVRGRSWGQVLEDKLQEDPGYAEILLADGTIPLPDTLHKALFVHGDDRDHKPARGRGTQPVAPDTRVEATVASPPEAPLPQGDAGEAFATSAEPAPPIEVAPGLLVEAEPVEKPRRKYVRKATGKKRGRPRKSPAE